MKKVLIFGVLILTGCVTTSEPVSVQPIYLTNKQIKETNDAALCSLSNTNPDPRIDSEIQSRKVNCEYASLVCSAKGIKKGTKKYKKCQEDQKIQQAESTNKAHNIARKQEPTCGFMQEFFGGVDCQQEKMGQKIRNCQSLDQWAQRTECKSNVIESHSNSPYANELAAYSRMIAEKVKAHKMTEAEADYAIQQKSVEVNERLFRANAEDRRLDLIEREQDMQAHQERQRRWNEVQKENADRLLDAMKNTNQPNITPIVRPTITTHCVPELGGGVRCTTD